MVRTVSCPTASGLASPTARFTVAGFHATQATDRISGGARPPPAHPRNCQYSPQIETGAPLMGVHNEALARSPHPEGVTSAQDGRSRRQLEMRRREARRAIDDEGAPVHSARLPSFARARVALVDGFLSVPALVRQRGWRIPDTRDPAYGLGRVLSQ